ncbi:MSF1-domain-containing protein [Cenococcum geophilum 1.58]|uniref:MSF1-domain-containing protein n=1 Tax=Cenococcum geophilum 1.58 TaxID=794803 RepID=UPI00358FD19E|nr:MSF1-domain-containing protein [Cenococcum geophilum 1.58]
MVKFYSSTYTYDYAFPAVTLAYFLRYPNPYSTHVLSTDVIERSFNPETQQLTTVRLHLKRSKLPSAVLKLLPRSLLGASKDGDSQSYILERSVVDVREGWMDTESRNLEWTGVLSVVEQQVFRRPAAAPPIAVTNPFPTPDSSAVAKSGLQTAPELEKTDVTSSVTLHSRLGQGRWKRRRVGSSAADDDATKLAATADEEAPKVGFFKSWSTASLQRSIELIGLKRARRSQPNAKEGMKVVLERLREGGLVAVLEGMRRDREMVHGASFKRIGARKEGEEGARWMEEVDEHYDE